MGFGFVEEEKEEHTGPKIEYKITDKLPYFNWDELLVDIKDITVDEMNNKIYINLDDSVEFSISDLKLNPVSRVVDTTCGISSPWREVIKKSLENAKEALKAKGEFKVSADLIHKSIVEMQKETTLFRETGGCHEAAIFNVDGMRLTLKEDIGRHNAIDKVIGDMLIQKKTFENVFLTSTGRLTGDSVLKAVRAKIPIVASLSAAIESGIRLAFTYGLTLIGFVRGSRLNIYTHPERIEL